MSNLYKNRYGVNEGKATRVIDSNELVARKLQELQREQRESALILEGEDGFKPGLTAQEVEVMPDVDYVAEAKAQAEQIILKAQAEADALRQESRIQAESLKESARNEGYQKGYEESSARAEQELAIKLAELEEKKQELADKYEERLLDMEPQLLDAVLQVVEKVFHIQFDDQKDILLYLLANTINGIEGCKHFQIRVGRESYDYVKEHQADIKERIGNDMTLDIVAASAIADDKCMIETDTGVFDCSLGVELENLIKALRALCS